MHTIKQQCLGTMLTQTFALTSLVLTDSQRRKTSSSAVHGVYDRPVSGTFPVLAPFQM